MHTFNIPNILCDFDIIVVATAYLDLGSLVIYCCAAVLGTLAWMLLAILYHQVHATKGYIYNVHVPLIARSTTVFGIL
jgi:hypothetical protein